MRHFQYVFDNMDTEAQKEARAEIETVMDQAEHIAIQRGKAGRYTNRSFGRREDIPALQCADAVAWTCYQFARLALKQKPLFPIAKEGWDDYYDEKTQWLWAATMTREELVRWLDAERKDGKRIERHLEWEASHPRKYITTLSQNSGRIFRKQKWI